jgi:two-component system, NtrC family, nitrogen regulation sensor histidine kinase NtrY
MINQKFRFNIFWRITLILLFAFLLTYVVLRQQMFFAPLVLGLCLVAVIYNLLRYIEKSHRDITRFLLSVRQGIFSETFATGKPDELQEDLRKTLNEVTREFAHVTLERELHYQFLQALNESIGVAILSFDENGNLQSMNPAAKRLLKFPGFKGLESLKQVDPRLYEALVQLKAEDKIIHTTVIDHEQVHLSVHVKEIVLQKKRIRIFLLQNLNHELETKELEAWQQLTRVLTHEIMNSVTPVVSLTTAMHNILEKTEGTRKSLSELEEENIDDIYCSVQTIRSRSEGLLKFIHAYKQFAKPLEAHLQTVDLMALINRVVTLLKPDLLAAGINVQVNSAAPAILVQADASLIEHVIINLLKNALEAIPHNGTGIVTIGIQQKNETGARITVADNGAGMDAETVKYIFIPFFTTKPKGSGIGLSFSRQIMRLHKGTIRVQSIPHLGTTFIVEWG